MVSNEGAHSGPESGAPTQHGEDVAYEIGERETQAHGNNDRTKQERHRLGPPSDRHENDQSERHRYMFKLR
jgi:hypothetical protein